MSQIEAVNTKQKRRYKYYDLIMAAFVTVLLCSNIIGAEKVVNLFGFSFQIPYN